MRCAHSQNRDGFTLVEISIVMIIIGLLVGGTFAGIRLISISEANRTVQDLQSIESAVLTFKEAYGRLPGDIPNPSVRLPNCSSPPCSTGGNGNRRIDPVQTMHVATEFRQALTTTQEKFTFWSHLNAADVLALGVKNTTDMNFGEGQPESPIGGGYRITEFSGSIWSCGTQYQNGIILVTQVASNELFSDPQWSKIPCERIHNVDLKIDDGLVHAGKFAGWDCAATNTGACNDVYNPSGTGNVWYDAKF